MESWGKNTSFFTAAFKDKMRPEFLKFIYDLYSTFLMLDGNINSHPIMYKLYTFDNVKCGTVFPARMWLNEYFT